MLLYEESKMEPIIKKKDLTFRKVKCTVIFHEYETVITIGVRGKRHVTGSYPPWFKDKKAYLIKLLKRAT